MVPTMNAVATGRKNAFAKYNTVTMAMISSATSANATTSARRMTGGCSSLLSGNGALAASTGTTRTGLAPALRRSLGDSLLKFALPEPGKTGDQDDADD